MKLSNYGRNFLHRRVVLNLFIYYLTTMFITKINQLHEIGKDLKWRTTYLYPRHSPSSVSTRLVDVASVPTGGRRSRALSKKNHNYINHNFHIIHHIHSFLYYYSYRNLFYLGIGINLFGSSKLKLWHFHAN